MTDLTKQEQLEHVCDCDTKSALVCKENPDCRPSYCKMRRFDPPVFVKEIPLSSKLRTIEPFSSQDGIKAEVEFHKLGGSGCVVITSDTPGFEQEEVVLSTREAHDLMLWLQCALGLRERSAPETSAQRMADLERALVYSAFHQHGTPEFMLPPRIILKDHDTVEVSFPDGRSVEATWPSRSAQETPRELSPSEAASFAKTLARSPRRVDQPENGKGD